MLRVVKGDLVELANQGRFNVIVHGCNCFCKMGAGIAKQIKLEFPEAYVADLRTKKGDRRKLGTYSYTKVERNGFHFVIVNAYTQYHYRRMMRRNLDMSALESCFKAIKEDFKGKSIAYPKIGAGLAGGDWGEILETINEALFDEDHTYVEYSK